MKIEQSINILKYPSTETQSQALGFAIISFFFLIFSIIFNVTILGILFFAIFIFCIWEYFLKIRYEKAYGKFLLSGLSISSDDVFDNSGKQIIYKGETFVCELHIIRHIFEMSRLAKEGKLGDIKIIAEVYKGLNLLINDFNSDRFSEVKYITIRSDLSELFERVGFEKIEKPSVTDLVTNTVRFFIQVVVSLIVGQNRIVPPSKMTLAFLPKEEFVKPEIKKKVDREITKDTYFF